MKTVLDLHGMHCSSCANTIEKRLSSTEGVESCSVNFATETAEVHHSPSVSQEELVAAVGETGYRASPHGAQQPHDHHVHEHGTSLPSMVWASVLALVVLVLAMGPMIGVPIPMSPWVGVVQLVFTLVVLFLGADVFRQGVLGAIRARRANMDTLIVLGTSAAFLYGVSTLSVWLMTGVYHAEQIYFESAALIMAFILIGRYLEGRAKGRSKGAIEELLRLAPETARIVVEGRDKEIPVGEVRVGDMLRVKPGDRIPVDGVITVGASRVNESMLTGEPSPVKKTNGDEVFAGTMNTKGMFIFRATKTGEDTAFRRIVSLVEHAQRSKSPVQRVADQISEYFVPAVIVLALGTFLYWMAFPAPGAEVPLAFAFTAAVSVLIISCPCALGLATPTAISVAMGTAGKRGLLFRDARALQKAAEVSMVALDKTGTLTLGRPEVVWVKAYQDLSEEVVFRYAASVESASEHPLGSAILRYADSKHVNYGEPRAFEAVEGKGIRAKVEGRKVVVGSLAFLQEEGIGIYDVRERIPELAEKGLTPVLVALEGRLVGLIGIADPLKDSAAQGVSDLHSMGVQTVMLTGDHEETARVIARQVGIDVVRAQVLPEDKLSELKRLQKKRGVAMVGDGINDAPALAQADVGIALGSGTSVAVESAEVVLVRDDIRDVAKSLRMARRTMRIIKQNLGWAFGYNIVAIPVAMGVLYPLTGWLLSPAIAAAAMAGSSLSVVLNSLRLRR